MTEHRNTPRDILFDMEDDIADLRRLGSTLLLLAQTEGLEDVVQDGLHHVASSLLDCHSVAHEKFKRLFDQIVRADTDTPEPANPVEREGRPEAQTTIRDLCHQWDVVRARLDLDLLESGHKEGDRIIDDARAQFRAIERAILDADPDTLRDVDLVVLLRLARKVIGNDEFTDMQEERCQGMLDLIDSALTRRTGPKDWDRAA